MLLIRGVLWLIILITNVALELAQRSEYSLFNISQLGLYRLKCNPWMGQVWRIPFSLIPLVYRLAPVQGQTRDSLDLNKSPIHGFGKGYKLNIYIKREVGLAETFNKQCSHFCVCKLYPSVSLSVLICPLLKKLSKFLEIS